MHDILRGRCNIYLVMLEGGFNFVKRVKWGQFLMMFECDTYSVAAAWCCWRVISVALRIVLDVSCVGKIKHEMSFFVAGAFFGDVGQWLLLLCACNGRFSCVRTIYQT